MDWKSPLPADADDGSVQPRGFFCHRYVLASGKSYAVTIAVERVRSNLKYWITDDDATVTFDVPEVRTAPLYKLTKPDNRGYTFYKKD